MNFCRQWMERFSWPSSRTPHLPLSIAHRGACAYRAENTLAAFNLASDLFAEMWELDLHMSSDGVPVVSHDNDLSRVSGSDVQISETKWQDIRSIELDGGCTVPRLEQVIALAQKRGAGLYIEAKAPGAATAAWRILEDFSFRFAAIGSFHVGWIAALRQEGCPYPLSILVPGGVDPFIYCAPAEPDIIHLCWRDVSDTPQTLVTKDIVRRSQALGAALVLWHEDRRHVLDALEQTPALGICSDCPEAIKPWIRDVAGSPGIVCHRGANFLAPENTLEGIRICIGQRFEYVEIDVRTTSDGKLVVIHDATLDRTTNGSGLVSKTKLEELASLDAGGWFSEKFVGARVPTLTEALSIAKGKAGVYIEFKEATPDAVLSEVNACGMLGEVFFSCEDPAIMRQVRKIEPRACLMAARWKYQSLAESIDDFGAGIVEYVPNLDDLAELAECRARGVRPMIYSQTHDIGKLQMILSSNPDLVNLDRPDLFKILAAYPDLAKTRLS